MGSPTVAVRTATLRGATALPVWVEVTTTGGLPGIEIVGMPDNAVLEASTRVRCAVDAAEFAIPRVRIVVNLAPGEIRKSGTGFDLPIAVAILIATGQISPRVAESALFVGELALDGSVGAVRGDVAYALLAEEQGLSLVVSAKSPLPLGWNEGALGIASLRQLRQGLEALPPIGSESPCAPEGVYDGTLDFADVVDQELPKRAMCIAAAGRHGILMVGPPGTGKTMLAKRLPSILPPLTAQEQAEAMLVHSVAGQPIDGLARGVRPFRAPHHSISRPGMVGGGRPVIPGECSLANRGVLYLDELPEFGHSTLQGLRQPLEEHEVRIVRVDGVYRFPSDFQLVASANPCPCGHLGDPGHECTCTPARVQEYQARIGGPLMDRIDMVVDVARPRSEQVIHGRTGMGSDQMRDLVFAARAFAKRREEKEGDAPDPVTAARLDAKAEASFERLAEQLCLGGRAIVRVARVARTIADMAEHERVSEDDLIEALGYRSRGLG